MKMVQKKTLKEIARESNVSSAMVSQILNGTGRASDQVKEKVLNLLEDNGYRPKYARFPFYYIVDLPHIELSGKTKNVLEHLSGIEQVFDANRLTLHVEFIKSTPKKEQFKAIINRKPSGVFINTDARFLDEACELFSKANIPIVQIGYDTENPEYNAVVMDGFSGAYMATKYLVQQGHQRIGMIRFTTGISAVNSNKKYAGYAAALADSGLEVDKRYVKELSEREEEFDYKPARYAAEQLYALPDPPTALFVDNSFISLSLLYPLAADKGEIPDFVRELDIVIFEDWPLELVHDTMSNKLLYPEMDTTLVCIDWENIGAQAAQLLIKKVNERSDLPEILRVNPALFRVQGRQRDPIRSF